MRALITLLAMLCLAPSLAYAQATGVQVSPVIIEMPAERGITSFRVMNGRDRETSFEAVAYVWTQEDGQNVLTPTNDIVIAPSVFLIPADGHQIVRLALPAQLRGGDQERSYRVMLRELPNPEEHVNGFRMVVEMSMPLFVTPNGARGTLSVARDQAAGGEPAVTLTNTGAARLHLSAAPDAEPIDNLPRYLLPGQRITRPYAPRTLSLLTATARSTETTLATIDLRDAPSVVTPR